MCVDSVLSSGSASQIQIIYSHTAAKQTEAQGAGVTLPHHRWSMGRWIKAQLTLGLLPHPGLIGWLRV